MNIVAPNKSITLYQERPRHALVRFISHPLVITLLICYALIAMSVTVYINAPKKYASSFSLMLPTAGSSSKVTLDEVGQVSQSSTSAFGNHAYSPLSNYQQIMLSRSVLKGAAESLEVKISDFGLPKIKALQQTSILSINIASTSPDSAIQKAWALYEALQTELDRLRLDEANRYEASIERMLSTHRDRLHRTRKAIVDFQQRSLLVSTSQMDTAVKTLAKVRDDLTFSQSERESLGQFVRRLSNHLGVSPALAGHALSLQSDIEFGAYLKELGDTSTQLSRYQSQWGPNHPKVTAEKQRFNQVLTQLQDRSQDVIGIHSARVLHSMNLNASTNLADLFSELLDSGAKLEGLEAKIRELQHAESRMDEQLRVFAREHAELERLEREHQRAEAIYNAAAATLEQGKTDIFSSYPIVQMLGQPSLPVDANSPKTVMALIFAFIGLFIVHCGVFIVWQRDHLINLLLKRY